VSSFNKVILLGNLTRDPEVRYTPSGTAICRLRLAVNSRYKSGEEWKDDTCYIDVVAFGKQAENCGQYLAKGSSVLVDGRLNYRTWETEDGQKRSVHEVVAQNVQFLTRRQSESVADAGKDLPQEAAEVPPVSEDDVPF